MCVRIFTGVEFDHRRAEAQSRIELAFLRLDKQADTNPSIGKAGDDWRYLVMQARCIQPAFRGAFLTLFRDDAGGMRFVPQGDFQHFFSRCHFKVEWQVGRSLDSRKVFIANMAPIFAQMCGDTVTANHGDNLCGTDRVGMIASARITDSRHVIDIHTKAQGNRHLSCGSPAW
jgi:hypothetical protein